MRVDHYILDGNGDPRPCADLFEWAAWFDRSRRTREFVVAHDRHEVRAPGEPEILVSTVFLALDHNWGDGPPLLYETLVMGGLLDGEMCRYATRAEALAGHQAMCRLVMESLR